ncbi:MAG: hypothetical protein ACKO6I_11075 [Sphingomonadales bacterium]
MKNISLRLVTALSVLVFFSCNTDIRKIREGRSNYIDKEVTVEGTVSSAIPLSGIFELKQDNATIYVHTQNDLPNKDEKITVKGIVKEKKIEYNGLQLINEVYIEEISREH